MYALLKTASQIQRSRRSQRPQDLPSAPFTAIFRQKRHCYFRAFCYWERAKEYIAWELDTHDYEHLSGIEQISIILKSYANILFIDPEGIRFSLDAEVALFNAGKNDRVINRPPDKFEEYTGPLSQAIVRGLSDGTVNPEANIKQLYYNAYDSILGLMRASR